MTAAAMAMAVDNVLHAKPTQICQRYQKELINYLRVGGDPSGWVRGELTFHLLPKGMHTIGNAFPVLTLCKDKVLCVKPTQFCQRYQKELMNYLHEWGGSIGMGQGGGQGGADLPSFAKRDANNGEYIISNVGCKIVSIIINNTATEQYVITSYFPSPQSCTLHPKKYLSPAHLTHQ